MKDRIVVEKELQFLRRQRQGLRDYRQWFAIYTNEPAPGECTCTECKERDARIAKLEALLSIH